MESEAEDFNKREWIVSGAVVADKNAEGWKEERTRIIQLHYSQIIGSFEDNSAATAQSYRDVRASCVIRLL